jgi:hypothetical protein
MSLWQDNMTNDGTVIDELRADHGQGHKERADFTRATERISFHDSVAMFGKGHVRWKRGFRTAASHSCK